MKLKFNFYTWWRYISGPKVVANAILYFDQFLFHTSNTKFISITCKQKNPDMFNILGVVRYRRFELK